MGSFEVEDVVAEGFKHTLDLVEFAFGDGEGDFGGITGFENVEFGWAASGAVG